jgi:hypothetical protein
MVTGTCYVGAHPLRATAKRDGAKIANEVAGRLADTIIALRARRKN